MLYAGRAERRSTAEGCREMEEREREGGEGRAGIMLHRHEEVRIERMKERRGINICLCLAVYQ